MKNKGMQLGAMLAAMLILSMAFAPMVSAKNETDIITNNYVAIEKAGEHAKIALSEFVAAGSPGIKGTDWKGASINPKPLTIYDINGKKLFYQYSIEKEGKSIGSIKTSASKVLGSSIVTIGLKPITLDYDAALQMTKQKLKENYKDSEITSTTLVSYSYPKIGIMVYLRDIKSNKEQRMFVDAYDYSIIPDRMPGDNGSGVWSLYESITEEEKVKRISAWEENDKKFREMAEQIFNGYSSKTLVTTQAISKILDVTLFAQEQSNYCAPAVGQMIAKYHGVSHTQTYIAGRMHTTSTGTNITNQLGYYRNDLGMRNSNAYSVVWSDMVNMINANKPFDSLITTPAGSHTRTVAGYYESGFKLIGIYDPYPVNQGDAYWEEFDFWNLEEHLNIYVY